MSERPTGAPAGWPLGAEDEDHCDLCGEAVTWGSEPTYGCLGRPPSRGEPQSGAPLGWVRHYRCHVACFGRPRSPSEIKADIDASLAKLKEVLAPGGLLDKVRDAVTGTTDSQRPDETSYAAQGTCGRCGRYAFLHPTRDCKQWTPEKGQWSE